MWDDENNYSDKIYAEPDVGDDVLGWDDSDAFGSDDEDNDHYQVCMTRCRSAYDVMTSSASSGNHVHCHHPYHHRHQVDCDKQW